MKKLAIITVAAIVMASCGGDEFASVGKKVDVNKLTLDVPMKSDHAFDKVSQEVRKLKSSSFSSTPKKTDCDYEILYFKSKDGKKGCVIDEKIAIPAVFDVVKSLKCDLKLFTVEKKQLYGLAEAFRKGYVAPCEYVDIDVDWNRKLLYLQKPQEGFETYSFETGKKWEGKEQWPPKKLPAEVPLKDLTEFPHWKIESVTCNRKGGVSLVGESSFGEGFNFRIEGVGLENWISSHTYREPFKSFRIQMENVEDIQNGLQSYPIIRKGQPFVIYFFVSDNSLKDVNAVSIVIKNY